MHISYRCDSSELNFVNDLVDRFLLNELPGATVANNESLVDVVATLFMGTRTIRLAGTPSPESQVMIREVIRSAISQGRPIPVLSTSGPKKNNSGQVDLAEFSAIQTLVCLQERVTKYYKPGMDFRIRLEDTTGIFLEQVDAAYDMQQYCSEFARLCAILESRLQPAESFVHAWKESSNKEGSDKMLMLACDNVSAFQYAIATGNQKLVEEAGWRGGVTPEWRKFLEDRYLRLFPSWTVDDREHLAAKYLSMTLARHLTHMLGNDPDWDIDGKHLELNFAPPSPGAPTASTRVFYRTMSTKQTKYHIPFWRGKGFFRLTDGTLRMGLIAGSDHSHKFQAGTLEIASSTDTLRIAADFLEE